eukprot:10518235-Karenia_brevis.AAC.1
MVVFLQEPKYDRWGQAFFCTDHNINLDDDDDIQFVHMPPDEFQCDACSRNPKPITRHRSSAMTEIIASLA